jgi:hypothetical protein
MTAQDVTAEIHGFSEPDSTPTPWAEGLEQLRAADTFWLSTVRPDGRPHVTPLIAVWHAEALWFATGAQGEGALDIVLEGRAERVTDDAELEPVATAIATKYPNSSALAFVSVAGAKTSASRPDPELQATCLKAGMGLSRR